MKDKSGRRVAVNEGSEMQALSSASLFGEDLPRRILLAPWGQVESTNGSFIVDEEAAQMVVEAFDRHGTDLPIDYEHQTLGGVYASPSGQAPAAGWIKRISAEPGVGLLAEIEWTADAAAKLESKQYRYVSPVAVIRKTDRKLVAIHSAALTNKPAIVGMTPIVNRGEAVGEDSELLVGLRRELKLADDAGPEEVLLAASERIAALEMSARARHVEERIAEAMRAGKLVEAQRAWAEALVAKEEGLFEEWLRTAPVIVQPGSLPPPNGDTIHRGKQAATARARAEFRAHPMLAGLTSEEAYAADAVRAACA